MMTDTPELKVHYRGEPVTPDNDYGDGGSDYTVCVSERKDGTTLTVVQALTERQKTFQLTTPFAQVATFCGTMSAGAWASHFPSKRKGKKA